MKIKLLGALVVATTLFSCSGDLPDVIETKSGLYGSKKGEFLIKFPKEPFVKSLHYQAGAFEYDEYIFQYEHAREHIYRVSYIDYPAELLNTWDTDQLFDQTMKTFSGIAENFKTVSRTVSQTKGFDNTVTYVLSSQASGEKLYMKTKLLKKGNRIYCIYFFSRRRQPEAEVIDGFINSFKYYKPKK